MYSTCCRYAGKNNRSASGVRRCVSGSRYFDFPLLPLARPLQESGFVWIFFLTLDICLDDYT